MNFACSHCGYVPDVPPPGGVYYCPKCGRRTIIGKRKKVFRGESPFLSQVSKPKLTSEYDKLVRGKKINHGYKEPYLNPQIPESFFSLKLRSDIKIFYQKNK